MILICIVYLGFCIASGYNYLATASKPYKISMLEMLPFTGNEPMNGAACRAASQLTVNMINERSNILPDYQIEMKFEDEDVAGQMSVRKAVAFQRFFEETSSRDNSSTMDNVYPSPVIIAGFFSDGCKGLGSMLHFIDSVAFSITCSATFLADRTIYPNMYLIRSTGRVLTYAQLHFIKDIGNWNRIAILTFVGNSYDYGSAAFLQNLASQNGASVSYFDGVIDVDDVAMASLKQSDSRVIVVWMIMVKMVWKFLCQTWKFGMTGSHYVFILLGTAISDPNYLPPTLWPGCTRAIIIEQLKYTFLVSPVLKNYVSEQKSLLGITPAEFDNLYDKFTNTSRPVDYESRFLCHDALLQAALTLDSAEKVLKPDNISLRDFKQSEYRHRIMKAVNDSAAKLDYMGLRIGRIRYNFMGEVNADVHMIGYWKQANQAIQYIATVSQYENASGYSYNDYLLAKQIQQPPWMTRNGLAPRDKSLIVRSVADVPVGVFVSVTIIACCLSLLQIISIILLGLRLKKPMTENLIDRTAKVAGGFGCVVVNVAAILFALRNNPEKLQLFWHLRMVFLSIGLSFVHGVLFSRIAIMSFGLQRKMARSSALLYRSESRSMRTARARKLASDKRRPKDFNMSPSLAVPIKGDTDHLHVHRDIHINNNSDSPGTNRYNTPSVSSARPNIFISETDIKILEQRSLVGIVAFLAINVVFVSVWLSVDPGKCNINEASPRYDDATDTYFEESVTLCYSTNQKAWQYVLVTGHGFILALSCILAYELHSRKADRYCPELLLKSIGTANALTLLAATLLILLSIGNPVNQQITISYVVLIVSGITSFTWFSPLAMSQHADAADSRSQNNTPVPNFLRTPSPTPQIRTTSV